MGKFILYLVIAVIIAFAANFFGIISIPWMDPPIKTEKSYYTGGRDRIKDSVNEMEKNSQ